jgi:hypothetical protein
MLLVHHFLQHVLGVLALAALERAHLIVIVNHCVLNAFMQVLFGFILYYFFVKKKYKKLIAEINQTSTTTTTTTTTTNPNPNP